MWLVVNLGLRVCLCSLWYPAGYPVGYLWWVSFILRHLGL